ncbi:UNVERIFIED_CONTAM: hypothetical protein FKN15_023382 [Acipenser sinensis]
MLSRFDSVRNAVGRVHAQKERLSPMNRFDSQWCGREVSEANTASAVLERDVANMTTPTESSPAEPVNIAAIVAPIVTLSCLVIAGIIGLVIFLKIREKRQTEGTYRPSSEEQAGTRVQPNTLKLPPGERLI